MQVSKGTSCSATSHSSRNLEMLLVTKPEMELVFGGMDGMWTVKIHSTLNTEVRYNYFILNLSHVWLCCRCGS